MTTHVKWTEIDSMTLDEMRAELAALRAKPFARIGGAGGPDADMGNAALRAKGVTDERRLARAERMLELGSAIEEHPDVLKRRGHGSPYGGAS